MSDLKERILDGFDPIKERDNVIEQIRNWFDREAPGTVAVIGMSGGKDSTIAAALLVRALGTDRVLGVTLFDGTQPDFAYAKEAIEVLKIPRTCCNIMDIKHEINKAVNGMYRIASYESEKMEHYADGLPFRMGPTSAMDQNVPPRIRMTLLRAIAQSIDKGGILINTGNKSENYIGYCTKDGDAAGDFAVLKDYTVTELLEIADKGLPELPRHLVHKEPSDGLCGKTDEENLGFSYEMEDAYLKGLHVDPEIALMIKRRHERNLHKQLYMPYVSRSCPE